MPSGLGEIRDDRRRLQQADRFHGQEFGISGAKPDTVELPGGDRHRHSFALASALMVAAAMALPPLRPRITRHGTRRSAISASFDSAAPTKPTGMPMIAAGGVTPSSSISNSRN